MEHKNLNDFRAAQWQARRERDRYAQSMADRWEHLKDPDTRGILMRDAIGDVLRSWSPIRKVQEMMHGKVSGSTVSTVGSTVASMLPGFKRRMIFTGVSMLLGKVIGDDPGKQSSTLSSLAGGMRSVAKFLRERKDKKTATAAAEVEA
ncbi:MAG: hypothetical protein WAU70_03310 [Flavobacteriales bacterium]